MAQIEVTDESVRALVDADSFARGALLAGKVAGLSVAGTKVEAVVDGVRVTARITAARLDGECECAGPVPCAHAVGAVLAWVHIADADEVSALRADIEDALADEDLDVDYLDELVDDAEALLPAVPEVVRDLADQLAARLDGIPDDGDGELAELLARVEGLYLEARRVAGPGTTVS